jgi:hypothetical protein
MADIIIWSSLKSHVPASLSRSLGPHAIKNWLRQHGYTVKVIDFCGYLDPQDIINITSRYVTKNTLAVGISESFLTPDDSNWVQQCHSAIKEKYPWLRWIVGGNTHQEPVIKKNQWIQFKGMAEDSFLQWVDQQRGITVKREPYDITCARYKWSEHDVILPNESLPLELGRGCKFKCSFCQYPLIGKKKGTYIRNFEDIKAELLENYEKFGVTSYYFIDDTVNEEDSKLQQLVDIAQGLPFKLEWVGYQRADLIYSHKPQAQWIKDSGCVGTFFGIESFHPTASKVVGKGWSGVHGKEFIPELIHNIWNDQIGSQLSFIIGLPGETKDDIWKTHDWCLENKINEWQFQALFIAHSNLYKSEFDRNFGLYGYKFEDTKNSYNWTNKDWTFESARNFQTEISLAGRLHIRPGCWSKLSSLKVLDMPVNSTATFQELTMGSNCVKVHRDKLDSYVQRSMSLPVSD